MLGVYVEVMKSVQFWKKLVLEVRSSCVRYVASKLLKVCSSVCSTVFKRNASCES